MYNEDILPSCALNFFTTILSQLSHWAKRQNYVSKCNLFKFVCAKSGKEHNLKKLNQKYESGLNIDFQ